MDTEIKGLADWFVDRHTVDPALSTQWPSDCPSAIRNGLTDRLLEVR